jgi:DNA end-binding protein Ku
MPHVIWKGAISFGLVHIPVRLYPATAHEAIGFDLLDRRTMDPIGYRKVNKETGEEVDRDDIARGYEYEKDKYVLLGDDEIRAASPRSTQTVDIVAFVDAPEISFLYLDTPYYLTPDKGGEKVYALLREALKKSHRVGVANVVMHGKQHLAAVIPIGAALALNTLRWASEVRAQEEYELPPAGTRQAGVSDKELKMAQRLIDDMSETFEPGQYHDTFHDDILALVRRKVREGKTREIEDVQVPEPNGGAEIVDLTELLRQSLSGRRKSAGAARKPAAAGKSAGRSARGATAKKTPTKATAKAAAADKPAPGEAEAAPKRRRA